ncbi:MAG: hypothetical protein ACOYMM_05105 [Phycisphaerales bacterium]
MHSNRNQRNAQQLRSIIQTMGRSIDEARNRRIGPTAPQTPSAPARPGDQASRNTIGESTATPAGANGGGASGSTTPPPIRAANEMFADGGPRLKARPKRAS